MARQGQGCHPIGRGFSDSLPLPKLRRKHNGNERGARCLNLIIYVKDVAEDITARKNLMNMIVGSI